ncbi:semaphorin-6A-like [Heteronotia binoei]|uniref:semaphorin-6A-like n=1 Tax=Heteronotia binoei TaxID=13085 RepID=UPI00292D3A72|nr:semaphorin-6A-like [Heteronotia binoei]
MAKCDIKSAFRLLPVHPDDFELLGFKFEGKFYTDRALPMGCSVSCAAFERFSSFLEWLLKDRSGRGKIVHYLDDFLFVGAARSGCCAKLLELFMKLADELGVPLAHEKTESPATQLTFLGIELDTFQQASRLPAEKVQQLRERLAALKRKYKEHYLAFTGFSKVYTQPVIKMDIQQTLIVNRMLYIAARNNIYAIELDRAYRFEMHYNREECQNFLKVFLKKNENELLICGTNAFDPICKYQKAESFAYLGEPFSGRGRCPFDGKDHNIALFSDGNLYSGTVTNYLSTDPVFQRTLGDLPDLRTAHQDLHWLNDPHFIHAVEYGNYIYVFFYEVSLELRSCGKVILPRVARVCKNDMGGRKVLQKQWTSFLKARMICSVHGDSPFYFNVLKSVTDIVRINGQDIVVGVFTTPRNSIPGSAVCAFEMHDIEKVFAGSFRQQKDYDTIWTPVHEEDVPSPRPGSCAGSEPFKEYTSSTEFPDKVLSFMKKHHLMHDAVQSTFTKPWFMMTMVRYRMTKIVIDTSVGPKENQIVAFLGTEQGKVLKVWDRSGNGPLLSDSILVEEMNIYKPDKCNYFGEEYPTIVSMELDKLSGALYVAFPHCVIKVPLGSCVIYGTCKKSCIASRDPYCIWISETGECKQVISGINVEYEQNLEEGDVSDMEDC